MGDWIDQTEGLSPAKRALFEQMLLRQRGTSQQEATVIPSGRGESPLSFAQQRLWFLDQLEPGNPAYNIPLALRLTGPLNRAALQQALAEIIRRHDVLRARFISVDGRPVQVISSAVPLDVPMFDLGGLPSGERETEVRRLIAEEALRPFTLADGKLIRASLLRVDEQEHIFLLTLHHIISDGWSMTVFIGEMVTLYDAFSANWPSPLSEPRIQYRDYAIWQREHLQGTALTEHLAYWREQLQDAPADLALPLSVERRAAQTFRGSVHAFSVDATVSERLTALSHQERASLFMTLLAAFQTLLWRYTGQDDIVVGSPVANRNRTEFEDVIGFFVNMLALRTRVEDHLTFRQLLRRVRGVALGAYAHQELPFERLVEELHPDRNPSYNPLFQVLFTLQTIPSPLLALRDITITSLDYCSPTTKFDLSIELTECELGLRGLWAYNTDLFDDSLIGGMVRHFQTLLAGISLNPDQRLSAFPLFDEVERQHLIASGCGPHTQYPRGCCVHELFHDCVQRNPRRIALTCEDQHMTYAELNSRANQVGQYLRSRGVGRGTLVGIYMERSIEMVVGLLGTLKAGAAYVPFDLAYPPERLAFMLDDASTPILLTQDHLLVDLPSTNAETVCLNRDLPLIEQQSKSDLLSEVTPEDLAYVMYTSGSTGRPKGVQVPHRAILRLLFAVDYVSLTCAQSILHMAPIAFDASTFELWGALLHGAHCVLLRDRVPTSESLRRSITQHNVTTLWLTASLFNTVVDEDPMMLAGVEQVLTGGEVLSPAHINRARAKLPSVQLINGYGPTEGTTFTCCYPIPPHAPPFTRAIPIGRSIANTRVHILDCWLEPVPTGVTGEMYIGGDGLARGYLHQPALTAEKFVPDPSSQEPGARLYRTGDLGRALPDGTIEFFGRADTQVKIRGYRIELGEIEVALNRHPAINASVVMVREDRRGERRLVAYFAARDRPPDSADLRTFLRSTLPYYMLPAVFIQLERIPVTTHGKVDRHALSHAAIVHASETNSAATPHTDLERGIARVWQDVLDTARVGVNDNFFDIGGHSLLAVQVHRRLRESLSVDISLLDVFNHPTIRALARYLERGREVATSSDGEQRPSRSRKPLLQHPGARKITLERKQEQE